MLLQCFGATREDVRFIPRKKSLVTQWINGRTSISVSATLFLTFLHIRFALHSYRVLFLSLETGKACFQYKEEDCYTLCNTNQLNVQSSKLILN
jgi:hypothetical protein